MDEEVSDLEALIGVNVVLTIVAKGVIAHMVGTLRMDAYHIYELICGKDRIVFTDNVITKTELHKTFGYIEITL